jgi:hypothetical protein
VQTNPFTSPTNIGNGVADTDGDSIRGANPGAVTFKLRLTRNAGKIDLLGSITGTDSVSLNPYTSSYSITGYSSATFPADGTFTFDRIGLFLGPNVDGGNATFSNSSITTVPEPATCALGAIGASGVLTTARRRRATAARGT